MKKHKLLKPGVWESRPRFVWSSLVSFNPTVLHLYPSLRIIRLFSCLFLSGQGSCGLHSSFNRTSFLFLHFLPIFATEFLLNLLISCLFSLVRVRKVLTFNPTSFLLTVHSFHSYSFYFIYSSSSFSHLISFVSQGSYGHLVWPLTRLSLLCRWPKNENNVWILKLQEVIFLARSPRFACTASSQSSWEKTRGKDSEEKIIITFNWIAVENDALKMCAEDSWSFLVGFTFHFLRQLNGKLLPA